MGTRIRRWCIGRLTTCRRPTKTARRACDAGLRAHFCESWASLRSHNWPPHLRVNRASITGLPTLRTFRLRTPARTILLGPRTLVMGVLNVTPDSFSDGGRYFGARTAIARGLALEAAGADLIDIGGESTRPGSKGVKA